jgi:hypothetical protein
MSVMTEALDPRLLQGEGENRRLDLLERIGRE